MGGGENGEAEHDPAAAGGGRCGGGGAGSFGFVAGSFGGETFDLDAGIGVDGSEAHGAFVLGLGAGALGGAGRLGLGAVGRFGAGPLGFGAAGLFGFALPGADAFVFELAQLDQRHLDGVVSRGGSGHSPTSAIETPGTWVGCGALKVGARSRVTNRSSCAILPVMWNCLVIGAAVLASCGGSSASPGAKAATPKPAAADPAQPTPPGGVLCPKDVYQSATANGGMCLDPTVLGEDVVDECGRELRARGWTVDDKVAKAIGEHMGTSIVCYHRPVSSSS